jgi:putative RecB family exonuclease
LAAAAEDLAAGADPEARFPARPAPRCGSCDVRRHCPEGRAAAAESEPWAQLSP